MAVRKRDVGCRLSAAQARRRPRLPGGAGEGEGRNGRPRCHGISRIRDSRPEPEPPRPAHDNAPMLGVRSNSSATTTAARSPKLAAAADAVHDRQHRRGVGVAGHDQQLRPSTAARPGSSTRGRSASTSVTSRSCETQRGMRPGWAGKAPARGLEASVRQHAPRRRGAHHLREQRHVRSGAHSRRSCRRSLPVARIALVGVAKDRRPPAAR